MKVCGSLSGGPTPVRCRQSAKHSHIFLAPLRGSLMGDFDSWNRYRYDIVSIGQVQRAENDLSLTPMQSVGA